MYWFAKVTLLGWLPLVMLLFLWLSPRRAVVVGMIGSWLFLPQLAYDIPLAPNYTKMTATCYAIILGGIILDPKSRVLKFQPSWVDIPIVVWCLVPFFTSVANELGLYDGASSVVGRTIVDGLPYLIGRLYFRTPEDARDLALGIVVGGLAYVPFCLYEVRMSPQLHNMVYGYSALRDFAMAKRMGGWRPTVFMEHGLAVGVWMAVAAAMAFWLWRTKAVKWIAGVPMFVWVPLLVVTAILVRSAGAIILLTGVMAALLMVHYFRTSLGIWAVLTVIPAYILLRATQLFDGQALVDMIEPLSEYRSASLKFRMDHENAIAVHAWEHMLVGWGGYGRAFQVWLPAYDSWGVPDSYWIRAMAQNGMIGLVSIYSAYLVGPFLLALKMKPREWADPRYAPIAGLVMVSLLYALDGLFNNMPNPVFIVAFGACAGMGQALGRNRAAPAAAAPPLPAEPPRRGGDDDIFDDEGLFGDDMPLILEESDDEPARRP